MISSLTLFKTHACFVLQHATTTHTEQIVPTPAALDAADRKSHVTTLAGRVSLDVLQVISERGVTLVRNG